MRPVVLVEWVDSASPVEVHQSLDTKQVADFGPLTMFTAGFLVRQDADAVVIAQDTMEDRWRALLAIPACCIKKVTVLRKGNADA